MATQAAMPLKEWAALIRVSPVTAWRKARDGEVEVINIGSALRPKLRVTEAAHQAYLDRCRIGGSSSTT